MLRYSISQQYARAIFTGDFIHNTGVSQIRKNIYTSGRNLILS